MPLVHQGVSRVPTLVDQRTNQGACQGELNVLRVDHRDLLLGNIVLSTLLSGDP